MPTPMSRTPWKYSSTSTSYETDDIQCRVNYENEKTVTDGRSTDAFLSGAKKTATGYIVEVAIPHTIDAFHSNQIVGFDVQVNDDGTGDGKRTSIANWNDLSGMGYTDPSGFGVLKLIGTDTPVVTTTTTGATDNDDHNYHSYSAAWQRPLWRCQPG